MDGLRSIVDSTGTLHYIEPPPEHAPGEPEEDFIRRYEAWFRRVMCWRVEIRDKTGTQTPPESAT